MHQQKPKNELVLLPKTNCTETSDSGLLLWMKIDGNGLKLEQIRPFVLCLGLEKLAKHLLLFSIPAKIHHGISLLVLPKKRNK